MSFGNHCIKWDVPVVVFKHGNTLQFMRNAYKNRATPRFVSLPESKGTIIKTTSHTQPRTRAVKTHQWYEHHVERKPEYGFSYTM